MFRTRSLRKSYLTFFLVVQDGITPLMYASKTGELEVVKIQLQIFAKIDRRKCTQFCSLFVLPGFIYINSSSGTFNRLLLFALEVNHQDVLD